MPDEDPEASFFAKVCIDEDETIYFGFGRPKSGHYVAMPVEVDDLVAAEILLDDNPAITSVTEFLPEFDVEANLFDPYVINKPAPKEWQADLSKLSMVTRDLIQPALVSKYLDRIGRPAVEQAQKNYEQAMRDKQSSGELDSRGAYERISFVERSRTHLDQLETNKQEDNCEDATRDMMRELLGGD